MEDKKTIGYLNSKVWYRLVKVAFIGLILFAILFSVGIAFDENSPRQVMDYRIDCIGENTNRKSFFAEEDASIYIYPYGTQTVYQALSDSAKKAIKERCDISIEEDAQHVEAVLAYIEEQEKAEAATSVIQKYLDENMRSYTVTKAYTTHGSYGEIVGYSLRLIIIILIVAEIMRRAFYYIVLGRLRPKK